MNVQYISSSGLRAWASPVGAAEYSVMDVSRFPILPAFIGLSLNCDGARYHSRMDTASHRLWLLLFWLSSFQSRYRKLFEACHSYMIDCIFCCMDGLFAEMAHVYCRNGFRDIPKWSTTLIPKVMVSVYRHKHPPPHFFSPISHFARN